MNTKNLPVIPMIFSGAGSCLTLANWEESGVTMLSCSLSAMLFKPGLTVLYKTESLAQYLGWKGKLVLNASMPPACPDGSYNLRSPMDGSRLSLLPETIEGLVAHLKADYVILPDEMRTTVRNLPFIESNLPSEDGFAGILYTRQGNIDIGNTAMGMQFSSIDASCSCPTCRQNFTRAYLHHLLANTPLLAQRLLIMHNVYWLNNQEKIPEKQDECIYGD